MLCVYKIDLILISYRVFLYPFVVKFVLRFVRVRLNQFLISSSMPSGSAWLRILSYLVSIALIAGTVRLWSRPLCLDCVLFAIPGWL